MRLTGLRGSAGYRVRILTAIKIAITSATTTAVLTTKAAEENPKNATPAATTNMLATNITSKDNGGIARSSVSANKFKFRWVIARKNKRGASLENHINVSLFPSFVLRSSPFNG